MFSRKLKLLVKRLTLEWQPVARNRLQFFLEAIHQHLQNQKRVLGFHFKPRNFSGAVLLTPAVVVVVIGVVLTQAHHTALSLISLLAAHSNYFLKSCFVVLDVLVLPSSSSLKLNRKVLFSGEHGRRKHFQSTLNNGKRNKTEKGLFTRTRYVLACCVIQCRKNVNKLALANAGK